MSPPMSCLPPIGNLSVLAVPPLGGPLMGGALATGVVRAPEWGWFPHEKTEELKG
ncbi:hypothetical protein KSB_33170 [Ktedonobacter robiniae]|uniref:Uncharacterized protein n=1 Tax=Ktedonobacter robiniae TaxID=2778365 RepID=A0ABQ3UQF9_9CHLR|nr:hypothetical protein KSB_33170 [Ktedonobacter robiniae]